MVRLDTLWQWFSVCLNILIPVACFCSPQTPMPNTGLAGRGKSLSCNINRLCCFLVEASWGLCLIMHHKAFPFCLICGRTLCEGRDTDAVLWASQPDLRLSSPSLSCLWGTHIRLTSCACAELATMEYWSIVGSLYYLSADGNIHP